MLVEVVGEGEVELFEVFAEGMVLSGVLLELPELVLDVGVSGGLGECCGELLGSMIGGIVGVIEMSGVVCDVVLRLPCSGSDEDGMFGIGVGINGYGEIGFEFGDCVGGLELVLYGKQVSSNKTFLLVIVLCVFMSYKR